MLNRRSFLKTTTASSSAAFLATTPPNTNAASPNHGYTYHLPSFKPASRLVFQGDSITDMKWGRNEADRNHYLGHSYVYLIAARLGVDLPQAKLNIFNRGISGHKVSDLKARWQKDAIDMQPDLLSILIGVNDRNDLTNQPEKLTNWENDYRQILTQSRTANPDLRLVLLDPFVLPSGKLAAPEQWAPIRNTINQQIIIVTKLAAEFNAVHIKTQAIFDDAAAAVTPDHWLWDGVHPLPQGHELIARHWIEALSKQKI